MVVNGCKLMTAISYIEWIFSCFLLPCETTMLVMVCYSYGLMKDETLSLSYEEKLTSVWHLSSISNIWVPF